MNEQHKIWAIRSGIGLGVCAALTAWMVPNTRPVGQPSPLAGMSAAAEAQKPTFSAIPDSAIPTWAASLQQAPAPPRAASPPLQTAALDTQPVETEATPSDVSDPPPDDTPAPPAAMRAPPAPPSVVVTRGGDYEARRAAWQAQLDSTMQAQGNPGVGG